MCHLLPFLFDINLSLFYSFKLGARSCSCLCPCGPKIAPWALMVQFQVLSRVTENRSWPLSIQIYPWCNFIEGEGAAMRIFWPHCPVTLSVSCRQQRESCPAKSVECSRSQTSPKALGLNWVSLAWQSTAATEGPVLFTWSKKNMCECIHPNL